MRITSLYTLIALVLLSLSSQLLAKSSVWAVSKDGHTIYVGGTIHLLKPKDFPYPPEFDQAYAQAEHVFFETDMAAVQSPAFASKMMGHMMFTEPGKTLKGSLSPKVYSALEAHTQSRGIPIGSLQSMKPAFVALTITVLEYQKLGYVAGVDDHYFKRLPSDNKAARWLETPDEQIAFITSMTDLPPDDLVRSTLDELKQLDTLGDKMTAAWRQGDADSLFTLAKDMKASYPKVYEQLLVKRNQNWLPIIEKAHASKKPTLFLVGALHLAGEDSVLAMLEKKGYTVEHARF